MFRQVEPEDLLKFGLIPEFVGRLPVIATLEDLDEEALKKILTEPKNALVKQYQRLFEMENTELTFQDEALNVVAKKAIERKTGARGLRSIMEGILLDTMFDLPGLDGVEQVVIGPEVVEGKARPLYIYAERARRKPAEHGQRSRHGSAERGMTRFCERRMRALESSGAPSVHLGRSSGECARNCDVGYQHCGCRFEPSPIADGGAQPTLMPSRSRVVGLSRLRARGESALTPEDTDR